MLTDMSKPTLRDARLFSRSCHHSIVSPVAKTSKLLRDKRFSPHVSNALGVVGSLSTIGMSQRELVR